MFTAVAYYTLVSSILAHCSQGHELPRLGQTDHMGITGDNQSWLTSGMQLWMV